MAKNLVSVINVEENIDKMSDLSPKRFEKPDIRQPDKWLTWIFRPQLSSVPFSGWTALRRCWVFRCERRTRPWRMRRSRRCRRTSSWPAWCSSRRRRPRCRPWMIQRSKVHRQQPLVRKNTWKYYIINLVTFISNVMLNFTFGLTICGLDICVFKSHSIIFYY